MRTTAPNRPPRTVDVVASGARRINEAHRAAQLAAAAAMMTGIEHAIEVGRLLAEEKAKHKHGEWIPWIKANLEFKRKQAAAYMRAFEHRGQFSNVQAPKTFEIGLQGAMKLLAKPREKRHQPSIDGDDESTNIVIESSDDDVAAALPPPIARVVTAPVGRRSVEKAERDEKIAALAKEEGCNAAAIARRLDISNSTVGASLKRQKLTRETANPLVKVLERAQLAADEWESVANLLRDGTGAAAKWPTATREQKQEVIEHVNDAIRFLRVVINRLNKGGIHASRK